MLFAKFILQLPKFVRDDGSTIVSMKNVLRHRPCLHVTCVLVYRIVPNANRTDVTLFLRRHVVNPEKVKISIIHVRDGSSIPLHVHSFGVEFLYGGEQINQVPRFCGGYGWGQIRIAINALGRSTCEPDGHSQRD
jgi:hypothetical protein